MSETLAMPTASQAPEGTPAPKPYLVCVLYYGNPDREHTKCVEGLKGKPEVGDIMEIIGCSYIDIGRSIAATVVLDQPERFGGLLFIDHDMIFEPEEALETIRSAQAADATVGAAYSMRRSGRIIGALDAKHLTPDEPVVFFEGGERRRASFLGMGMTAISRSVFVRMVEWSKAEHSHRKALVQTLRECIEDSMTEHRRALAIETLDALSLELAPEHLPRLSSGLSDAPVVPFFSLLQREGIYYGEDVSFCARSHMAKIPVWLDTRIRVGHKGSYVFQLEDVSIQVPFYSSMTCMNVPEPKITDAPPTASGLISEVTTPKPRPVKLVTATRGSAEDFWQKSLLGQSLSLIPRQLAPEIVIAAHNTEGLSAVYNRALAESSPETLLVFVHDDVFIHDPTLIWSLRKAHEAAQVVGLAGSSGSDFAEPSWLLHFDGELRPMGWQGSLASSGAVSHCPSDLPPGEVPLLNLTLFGEAPARVDLLDGLFLSVDVGAMQSAQVQFDERFDFHLYDLDLCRSAAAKGLVLATWPIVVTHGSGGNFDSESWRSGARRYLAKWATSTPAKAQAAE
jgi:hypothetical protein